MADQWSEFTIVRLVIDVIALEMAARYINGVPAHERFREWRRLIRKRDGGLMEQDDAYYSRR